MVEESIAAARCFDFVPHLAPTVMEDNELQYIDVPMLFLVGENEKIYSAREAVAHLNKVAPQIRTEVLSGVGHDIIRVHPEQITEKVLGFLGRPE